MMPAAGKLTAAAAKSRPPSSIHSGAKPFKKTAFTLVEILIALSVLALGIISLFNIFPSAWHSFAYSRKINLVTQVAQQKLEELKSLERPSAGTTKGESQGISWAMSVSPNTMDPGVTLYHVELTVIFSLRGTSYAEKFITYIQQ
jgi:prepilin-type N-terminal cleavage/methylation domain-containing protein